MANIFTGVSKTPTRGRVGVSFFPPFFAIYLQIDSFWSKKYLLVYNGKSFHSQTGCSLPGNFANFRRNIDILIDKLATSANHLLASVRKFVCVDSSEDCS